MPIFEIQDAQGKIYEVDAPDIMTAGKAFQSYTPAAPSGQGEDILKSGVSGLASGATKLAGLIPDVTSIAKGAANKYLFDPLLNATLGQPSKPLTPENQPPDINAMAGSANIQKSVESLTGDFYKPQTTAGKYAHSVGEALPGSVLMPGSAAFRALSGVGAGVGSEAAGQSVEGTRYEPYAPYARIAGAVGGGMAPSIAGRVVTPLPANVARQRNVDILSDEGVTSLTAGQRTGNKRLQWLESASGNAPMAGGRADAIQEAGQRQFTGAAMRRAGAGPDASPEVLAANNQRLGQEFRGLSARNNLVPDNQFVNDIVDAARNYRRVPDSQQRAMVQGYVDDIIQHVNQGTMPGAQYQEMRSRLSRQANSLRQSDPTLSEALRDMRVALDNAMGRSISPADQQAWQTARREYGAQKLIEKTASRAGEATAEGQLVPANLRNAIPKIGGGYARGEGEFTDLARAGAGVMSPLPNSGTAQRQNAFDLLNQMTLGAVPAITGRTLMSRPVQSYLSNQLLARGLRDDPAGRRALFQALAEVSRNKLSPPVR